MILSVFKEFYNMQKNLFSSPLTGLAKLRPCVYKKIKNLNEKSGTL